MIVLSRKKNDSIIIGDSIRVLVVEIGEDMVRLGIDAPREVPVHRREVYEALHGNPTRQTRVRVTLEPEHVQLVDRIRDVMRRRSGIAPSRDEVIAGLLDGVADQEPELAGVAGIEELKQVVFAAASEARV